MKYKGWVLSDTRERLAAVFMDSHGNIASVSKATAEHIMMGRPHHITRTISREMVEAAFLNLRAA